jgi:hypothetical protein
VSICTLDTLSTSLTIYRAEAVFVGLGMWDLYAGVVGGWIRCAPVVDLWKGKANSVHQSELGQIV